MKIILYKLPNITHNTAHVLHNIENTKYIFDYYFHHHYFLKQYSQQPFFCLLCCLNLESGHGGTPDSALISKNAPYCKVWSMLQWKIKTYHIMLWWLSDQTTQMNFFIQFALISLPSQVKSVHSYLSLWGAYLLD